MTTAASTQESANAGRPAGRLERLLRSRLLGHGLFWSWNAIFIIYAGFGLLPVVVSPMVRDALSGTAPIDLAAALLSVLAVPVGATVWGVFLRRDSERLLRLFYGLEMPLFFLCVGRVFLVREITAPLAVFAGAAAIGWGAFAIDLLHPAPDARSRLDWPRLVGLSVLVAITAYVGLLATFYVVPGLVAVPKGLLEMVSGFGRSSESAPFAVLAVIVFAFASTLLLVLPVAATLLYLGAWLRALRRHTRLHGKRVTNTVASSAVVLFAIVLVASSRQPQRRAFSLLEHLPTTDAERQQRLQQSTSIRRGLVNAYLAPQRYLAATEGSHSRAAALLWAHTFGGTPERYDFVQKLHDLLAAPILYDGDARSDRPRAEHEYEQFFDEPLEKAEADSVNRALSATWRRDRPQAGLLDRDAAVVHATEQTVTVREMGAVAEIELHECYQNLTQRAQEVLLHFSLPEDSVLTGLWLGASGDRNEADEFIVAPRGAAQRVYNGEVRASFDPALLEQLGPRQFRLRAFPVPANSDQTDADPHQMHVWLRAVVADHAGRWPLPRLLEKRNVFWNSDTRRQLVHGDGQSTLPPVDGRGWLPVSIARRTAAPANDQAIIEAQVGGLRVRLTPAEAASPKNRSGRRYVVVVDRSRSMERHRAALDTELRWLRTYVAGNNDVDDAFLPAAPSRGEEGRLARLGELDAGRIVFYGGQPLSDMLRQLQERTAGQEYEAVIVLTDDGGYDLEPPDAPPLSLTAPLWIVHLDDTLPVGYSDVVTRLLTRASSGLASSAADALAHVAVAAFSASGGGRMLAGAHLVETTPASGPDSQPSPASAIAARAAVAMLSGATPGDAEALDKLHAIAKWHGIVTPSSSMIVLVNERQRQNLDRASESASRFNRTVESGKQGTEWMVSGVPEPEEWALIVLAAALLGSFAWRARRRHQAAGVSVP